MSSDNQRPPGGQAPRDQHWDPERYARNARFVSDLGRPVLELLAPADGEKILDLGCGDGPLTLEIMRSGAEVLGLDASPEQVAAARAAGVDALVGDAMALDFDQAFDAVFSNAALHWMTRPAAVIDGVWRALRPGGRFVGEMGGQGNVGRIHAALISALDRRGIDGRAADPWYFPSPEAYRARLEKRGFEVREIALHLRPTELPGAMEHWLQTFAEPFIKALPRVDRAAFLTEVSAALRPELFIQRRWTADYVRLRFLAFRPPTSSGMADDTKGTLASGGAPS
jgi:trans-aconitate methyltransferase